MKKIFSFIVTAMIISSCSSGSTKTPSPEPKPWNISIYLDLSDRLKKGNGERQMQRDTAIIGKIIQLYIDHVVANKIVPCNDKIQIFFYPTEDVPNASTITQSLVIDLEKLKNTPAEKKKILVSMRQDMLKAVTPIYTTVLRNQNWIGSDIWGFFKDKIRISCVRPNHRNILFILTDGYIYHENNVRKEGVAYSYLLSKNIDIPNMKLISCNKNLDNLEVMCLEINPIKTKPQHYDKMKHIIGTWLTSMGVKHYDIVQTDASNYVFPAIENFLQSKE